MEAATTWRLVVGVKLCLRGGSFCFSTRGDDLAKRFWAECLICLMLAGGREVLSDLASVRRTVLATEIRGINDVRPEVEEE